MHTLYTLHWMQTPAMQTTYAKIYANNIYTLYLMHTLYLTHILYLMHTFNAQPVLNAHPVFNAHF